MTSPRRTEIAERLAELDDRLALIAGIVGPPPSRRALPVDRRFERLAVSILHQQLAVAAAATITTRATVAVGGSFTPTAVLSTPEAELRACGVSAAKAAALYDLATQVGSGHVDLGGLGRRSDEDVVAALSSIRGIGRWTAEMFLMGPLGRHDVWPVGDLGVRSGWAILSGTATESPADLLGAADHLRPWRSSVAWYCWQAVGVARSNDGQLRR